MTATPSVQAASPADLAVIRAVLEHHGYKGAAAALNVPHATVRTRVHRALRRTGYPSLAEIAYALGRSDERK